MCGLLWRWQSWNSGGVVLLAQLQLAREAHGDDEGLRVVDFHVEAKRRLQSCRERLYTLRLRERADARKQRLEAGLVLCYRARSLARHQLTKRVGADRRPKAEVEELGEAAPRWCTLVLLHLEEPHLGAVFKVV